MFRRHGGSAAMGAGVARQNLRAIIDIGSNTVRLVIYGGAPRAPAVLFNEKVVAQLGLGVARTGRLADDSMALACQGLARFALILADFGIERVDTVATAAVREASNRDAFLGKIRAAGLSPRILSGEAEAEASALGVIGAFPSARGMVADLGGGSLELVQVDNGAVKPGISLPLGTLRLAELKQARGAEYFKAVVQALKPAGGAHGGTLYLVGGTWRAIAIHVLESGGHVLTDPHGLSLASSEAKALASSLQRAAPAKLAALPRMSNMRAGKLPDAAVLLQALLRQLSPERVVFSSWGLREGLLYGSLPRAVQMQDPLLAGMTEFGLSQRVPPLLAARIAAWTADAARATDSGNGGERLRLAATTLALASMDIEPNLRTRNAVEWALHKRWLTIGGAERAMLATTVCGNGNVSPLPPELHGLARPEQMDRAFAWGLAIRLCRRLGGGSPQSLEASRLEIVRDCLLLTVADSHRALCTAAVTKDLRLLAERLGLMWALVFAELDEPEPSASTEALAGPGDGERV